MGDVKIEAISGDIDICMQYTTRRYNKSRQMNGVYPYTNSIFRLFECAVLHNIKCYKRACFLYAPCKAQSTPMPYAYTDVSIHTQTHPVMFVFS